MSDGGSFTLHSRPDPQSLKSEANQASDFNTDEEVPPGCSSPSLGFFLQIHQGGDAAIKATGAATVMGSMVTFAEQGQSLGFGFFLYYMFFFGQDYLRDSFAFQRSV